jgi:hypothetical protein
MLIALPHREAALSREAGHRHAMAGNLARDVPVCLEVRLLQTQVSVDLRQGINDLLGHHLVSSAVEQPHPVIAEVDGIIDQPLLPCLLDEAQRVVRSWGGGTNTIVAVAKVVGAGHHSRRDTVEPHIPEGPVGMRNTLNTAVWTSRDKPRSFHNGGVRNVELVSEEGS